MVSKTLLFSCVASLALVVVSEPGPVQAGGIFHDTSDSTSGASLVHTQSLLSQHITDLSALLNNFTNGVETPVGGTVCLISCLIHHTIGPLTLSPPGEC